MGLTKNMNDRMDEAWRVEHAEELKAEEQRLMGRVEKSMIATTDRLLNHIRDSLHAHDLPVYTWAMIGAEIFTQSVAWTVRATLASQKDFDVRKFLEICGEKLSQDLMRIEKEENARW